MARPVDFKRFSRGLAPPAACALSFESHLRPAAPPSPSPSYSPSNTRVDCLYLTRRSPSLSLPSSQTLRSKQSLISQLGPITISFYVFLKIFRILFPQLLPLLLALDSRTSHEPSLVSSICSRTSSQVVQVATCYHTFLIPLPTVRAPLPRIRSCLVNFFRPPRSAFPFATRLRQPRSLRTNC